MIISFEKFLEIAEFLERHAYFYSKEVQERLRKSDEDLEVGRYVEVKATEIDKALEWLHGGSVTGIVTKIFALEAYQR